jgi:hypothetical protein
MLEGVGKVLRGLGTSLWNYFDLTKNDYKLPVKPEITLVDHIVEVLKADLGVDFNGGEISLYKDDENNFGVDYLSPDPKKAVPVWESFDDPKDAAKRFLEVRDGELIAGANDPQEYDAAMETAEILYSDEMKVLRQLFDNMKLESGRTVTEELAAIETASYRWRVGLESQSWKILVDKIKALISA